MSIDFDGVALHQVCCGVALRKILGDVEVLRPAYLFGGVSLRLEFLFIFLLFFY